MANGEKFYFLAILEGKDFVVYATQPYRLTEIDLINLIKICLIEKRGKNIGEKLLKVYEDVTQKSPEAIEKLRAIGLEQFGTEPEKVMKKDTRTK